MKRWIQFTGLVLALFLALSLEIAPQTQPGLFSVSEAEAFRRGRHHQKDSSGQSQKAAAEKGGTTADEATSQPPARAKEAQDAPQSGGANPPIGTVVQTLPSGCQPKVLNGIRYSNCGGTFYRAAIQGSNLVYLVVEKP